MVVAPVVIAGEPALAVDRASEFPAPDYEGVVEQSAPPQIGHEGVAGAVGRGAQSRDGAHGVLVDVPAPLVDLGEADASLRQPAGEEAVVGEGSRIFRL